MTSLRNYIRGLTLKQKLLVSFMLTSSASLVLACSIFMIHDYVSERNDMIGGATVLADTIANTSTAALVFDDKKSAGEILQALKAHPHIEMAALYRKDGTVIALYVRQRTVGQPVPSARDNNQSFDQSFIHVFRSINLETEKIGTIYLRYNLTSLATRQLNFLSLVLLVVLLASCFSYIIASRLMRFIAQPLNNLSEVARSISLNKDYSIRAKRFNADEIGALSDSLNEMLAQIQERDGLLLKYHEQLEKQVAERTCELETTNSHLKLEITERINAEKARQLMEDELLKSRKLESIGVLAGGIAHNFNNILTSIVGYISLANNRTKDNEKVQGFLSNAEKGCYRAKGLTQQLLTFSRGGKPVRRVTTLAPVIREAIDISFAGSNVICDAQIAEELNSADIDTGQIIQVLNNLMVNACQAMPNGGSVVVRVDNIYIDNDTVFPITPGEYIEITVEDTGCGISEENLHRVFDPYFTTKPSGNGLGLATCYSIIKNHGGLISVSSELDKGTTFTLFLPAARYVQSLATPVITALGDGTDVLKEFTRVLIMDDEQIIRDVAYEMFTTLGYSASLACDGAEAISMYREAKEAGTPFEITIMDMTIPGGMGGVEAVGKLLEYDSNAFVVVSSGYTNEAVMSNYRSYGFKGVIPKPYTLNELKTLLKSFN